MNNVLFYQNFFLGVLIVFCAFFFDDPMFSIPALLFGLIAGVFYE